MANAFLKAKKSHGWIKFSTYDEFLGLLLRHNNSSFSIMPVQDRSTTDLTGATLSINSKPQ